MDRAFRKRELFLLLWPRGCGVSPGARPSGERVFCVSHRISTEKGHRTKSHIQECKTPETLSATQEPHPDWCECLARTRKQ